jgi:Na+-translocating ferredoxin:NAD+ oxidoreductase RNF subunit RnfB
MRNYKKSLPGEDIIFCGYTGLSSYADAMIEIAMQS